MLTHFDDGHLLDEVRSNGNNNAYAELFRRHRTVALRVANRYTRDPHLAEDAVVESFASIMTAIRGGKGPVETFTPYLYTTVQRTVQRMNLTSYNETAVLDAGHEDVVGDPGPGTAGFESSAARGAFMALPERWRQVIWYLDIEQKAPREVAPILGLSPNATVALHRRAKDGLRVSYLQQQLNKNNPAECAPFAQDIPGFLLGSLSKRRQGQVSAHLGDCSPCKEIVPQLENAGRFHGWIIAVLLMVPTPLLMPDAMFDGVAGLAPDAATAPLAGTEGAVSPVLPGSPSDLVPAVAGHAGAVWPVVAAAVGVAAAAAAVVAMVVLPGNPPAVVQPHDAPDAAAALALPQGSAAAFTITEHSGERAGGRVAVNFSGPVAGGTTVALAAGTGARFLGFQAEVAEGWDCATSPDGGVACTASGTTVKELAIQVDMDRPKCGSAGEMTVVVRYGGEEQFLGSWASPCVSVP